MILLALTIQIGTLLYKQVIILTYNDGGDNMGYSFDEWAEIYKIFGDKTRLHLLSLLSRRECCVCELTDIVNMSQPGISQHLRKLKQAGIVKERKTAQWVYYSLDGQNIPFFHELVKYLPDVSEEVANLQDQTVRCNRE